VISYAFSYNCERVEIVCGIAGFLDLSSQKKTDIFQNIVTNMTATLKHRGPDDTGLWIDNAAGIALGHARLSIIDLTAEGHQPMHSECSRYVIVFNGEIYNFKALRFEIEGLGHIFHGHSDTEVMLEAIRRWGLKNALNRFNGMFAFALWDRKQRLLHLVRDRLGEKPLYYGWMGNDFLFGSELKALRAHPKFESEINRNALALYLRHMYIPAPHSIYKGIYKLIPGTILTINASHKRDMPELTTYWSAKGAVEQGASELFIGSPKEAFVQLENLLKDAVLLRMNADVPLGAFLSGGVDSSIIVAMMQMQSNRQVKTFSIGFYEDSYNEANYAKSVAKHLKTEHTELYIKSEEAIDIIPYLPCLYDEPFADVSQVPTFLVSKLTRQDVTVCLSGDGGDELFCGYKRYKLAQDIWRKYQWLPISYRHALSKILGTIPPNPVDKGFRWLTYILNKYGYTGTVSNKLNYFAENLMADRPEQIYLKLTSVWKNITSIVKGSCELSTPLTNCCYWANILDFTQHMMYLDSISYLPDDILVKVDRATMGVGLEGRIPLLDHRIFEFAWRLPLSLKLRNGQTKWLLRQILYKYVPQSLIERPKMGFGLPIGMWLRGPLLKWAENLLNEKRLQDEGFLNPMPIRRKWLEHLAGKRNWENHLWTVLMFQAWKDYWLS